MGYSMVCFLFQTPEYTMYCTLAKKTEEKKTKNTLYNFGVCTKAIYKVDISLLPTNDFPN